MSARARCAWLGTFALILAFAPVMQRMLHAAAVLGELTGMPLPAAEGAGLALQVTEELTSVALPGEPPVRARRYRARGAAVPARAGGVLLLHGVHARGIDELRLVAFARALAQGGLDVLTPELPELLAYRLNASTSAHIRQLAAAHAQALQAAAVGVIGISFAGGLALLAAAQQRGSAPIGFVVTVGAHEDLSRVCRYYAGEDVRGPRGEAVDVKPHPYGARVMIREHLDRFFAAPDLPLAQRALDLYLHDQHREARQLAQSLSPAGRGAMAVLLAPAGSPELSSWITQAAAAAAPQLMAASPRGQLAQLHVPVFLLHGEGDPVIPSIETRYLARDVPKRWLRAAIITPLLRHAEFPEPPSLGQAYELVRLVKGIYEASATCSGRSPASG